MEKVVIGLGSNLGDRLKQIQQALVSLDGLLQHLEVSTLVESKALLAPDSPREWDLPFLNCAVSGETTLSPRELLQELKKIEQKMGPRQKERWSPRALDLDLLFYGDQKIEEPGLAIPHKEISHRPFVLHPLAQLMPFRKYQGKTFLEWVHPAPLDFSHFLVAKPYFVGVLNLTPDSFSDGGLYFHPEQALAQAQRLFEEGASFIELGAASLRPEKSSLLPVEEEWRRLQPVLAALQNFNPRPRLSVDTYHTETALRALDEFDVAMINFLGEKVERDLAKKIEREQKQIVVMHKMTLIPSAKAVLPFEEDPIAQILSWGASQIEELGIDKKHILIDPGIGFGKTAIQNLYLLKNIRQLQALGTPLFVGHSRKLFHTFFSLKKAPDRDPESATISIHLAQEGVAYLRVHNVKIHQEQLVAHRALSLGARHG